MKNLSLRVLALCLLSIFGVPALAADSPFTTGKGGPGVVAGSTGGWVLTPGSTFVDPPPTRSYGGGGTGSAARFTLLDPLSVAGKAAPVGAAAMQSMTARNVAAAAGRCLVLANPACLVGFGITAGVIEYRARHPSQVPGSVVGSGLIDFDPGTAPVSGTVTSRQYTFHEGASGWHASPDAAKSAINAYWAGSAPPTWCGTKTVSADGLGPSGVRGYYAPGGGTCGTEGQWNNPYGGELYRTHRDVSAAGNTCPASIDPGNSAYNVPAGSPVGPDGKCPTARYHHQGVTPDAFGQHVESYPPAATSPAWQNLLRDAINSGQQVPSTVNTQGPASKTGDATTTTTSSSGQPTTTETKTPTYNYTYNGDTINYTTVTVTSNSATNVTNTTTTPSSAEVEVCGLPGKPKCAIDETGTPDGSAAVAQATSVIDAAKAKAVADVGTVVQPGGFGWSFDLALPSGTCTAISGAIPRFATVTYFDPCDNPNVELMRLLLSWVVGIMAALYIWRSVTQTVNGSS